MRPLYLLFLSLVAADSAPNTFCLTRFNANARPRWLPTRTSTVTVKHSQTPGYWKRGAEQETCSLWTTVTATGVSTVYTGTLNHNNATATPDALAKRAPRGFHHQAGQPPDHMMSHAYLVECFVMYHMTPTAAVLTTQVSSTASSSAIRTASSSAFAIVPSISTSADTCTSKTITTTAVTTQDIRCAPSNMISTVEPGRAIGQMTYVNPALVRLTGISDCCQLCMDMDGCSSMEADVAAGNCWLLFGNSRCETALYYYQDPDPQVLPTNAFVQSGCGPIVSGTKAP